MVGQSNMPSMAEELGIKKEVKIEKKVSSPLYDFARSQG